MSTDSLVSIPDWDLIESEAGEEAASTIRALIGALYELQRVQRVELRAIPLSQDQIGGTATTRYSLADGSPIIDLGFVDANGTGWSDTGPGIVLRDPAQEYRPSWAVMAGTTDALTGSRDALRFVDVVNGAQVFQVTQIGSGEYAVHPKETNATAPIVADLGYNNSGDKWRNLYLSGTVFAGTLSGAGVVPVGSILEYAGSSLPDNYLWADGTSYTTSSKAALFSAIGYAFGGSGANFNVPDKRDKQSIGKGTSFPTLGATVGAATHTHSQGVTGASGAATPSVTGTTGAGQAHTHDIQSSTVEVQTGTGETVIQTVGTGIPETTDIEDVHTHGAGSLAVSISDHTHSNPSTDATNHLYTSLVCNYIIRYQ